MARLLTKQTAQRAKAELEDGVSYKGMALTLGARQQRISSLVRYKDSIPSRYRAGWETFLVEAGNAWRRLVVTKFRARRAATAKAKRAVRRSTLLPSPILAAPPGLPQHWTEEAVGEHFARLRRLKAEKGPHEPGVRVTNITHFRRVGRHGRFEFWCSLRAIQQRRDQKATPFWVAFLDVQAMPSGKAWLAAHGWRMVDYWDWYPKGGCDFAELEDPNSCDENGNRRDRAAFARDGAAANMQPQAVKRQRRS